MWQSKNFLRFVSLPFEPVALCVDDVFNAVNRTVLTKLLEHSASCPISLFRASFGPCFGKNRHSGAVALVYSSRIYTSRSHLLLRTECADKIPAPVFLAKDLFAFGQKRVCWPFFFSIRRSAWENLKAACPRPEIPLVVFLAKLCKGGQSSISCTI